MKGAAIPLMGTLRSAAVSRSQAWMCDASTAFDDAAVLDVARGSFVGRQSGLELRCIREIGGRLGRVSGNRSIEVLKGAEESAFLLCGVETRICMQ